MCQPVGRYLVLVDRYIHMYFKSSCEYYSVIHRGWCLKAPSRVNGHVEHSIGVFLIFILYGKWQYWYFVCQRNLGVYPDTNEATPRPSGSRRRRPDWSRLPESTNPTIKKKYNVIRFTSILKVRLGSVLFYFKTRVIISEVPHSQFVHDEEIIFVSSTKCVFACFIVFRSLLFLPSLKNIYRFIG